MSAADSTEPVSVTIDVDDVRITITVQRRPAINVAVREGDTIQRQVEVLVEALGRPVTATELLGHLPEGTRREAVNWALWSAAERGALVRTARGLYTPAASAEE